ncbi:MAG: hypothetical protein V4687_17960 [Bacteroidota bacterium]
MRIHARSNQEEHYKYRVEAAKNAFERRHLIWSRDNKRWYTPREFVESDEIIKFKFVGVQKIYENIDLFDIQFAIRSKVSGIKKAQEDFEAFMTKVFTAFELQPISKNKKT